MPRHYKIPTDFKRRTHVGDEEQPKSGNVGDLLQIKPLPTKALEHKSPPLMSKIGIKHPFSMCVVGCSGSGKTVFTCTLLLNKKMFYKFFNEVYLITPTGSADDTFELLGLPKNNIITENFEDRLKKIIEKQEGEVEQKGVLEADRVLVIFEDLTSLKKLQNSAEFTKIYVQNRHLNISVISCVHKYRAFNRTCRMNSNHLIIFPCTNSEREIIADENATPNWNKKTFSTMLSHAFTPNEQNKRPFLWINNKAQPEDRFRKNLTRILSPDTPEK